jgi:hypothetical protein
VSIGLQPPVREARWGGLKSAFSSYAIRQAQKRLGYGKKFAIPNASIAATELPHAIVDRYLSCLRPQPA